MIIDGFEKLEYQSVNTDKYFVIKIVKANNKVKMFSYDVNCKDKGIEESIKFLLYHLSAKEGDFYQKVQEIANKYGMEKKYLSSLGLQLSNNVLNKTVNPSIAYLEKCFKL